jgi:hypothetical protein
MGASLPALDIYKQNVLIGRLLGYLPEWLASQVATGRPR